MTCDYFTAYYRLCILVGLNKALPLTLYQRQFFPICEFYTTRMLAIDVSIASLTIPVLTVAARRKSTSICSLTCVDWCVLANV